MRQQRHSRNPTNSAAKAAVATTQYLGGPSSNPVHSQAPVLSNATTAPDDSSQSCLFKDSDLQRRSEAAPVFALLAQGEYYFRKTLPWSKKTVINCHQAVTLFALDASE